MDPLHVIPEEEWPKLQEFLKRDWPRCFVLTSWMGIRKRWNASHPGRNPAYICCPYGVIEDGLVAFGRMGGKHYSITIQTFHEDLTKLRRALLQSRKIDWERDIISAVPKGMENWYQEIINELGCSVNHSTPTKYYWLPREMPQTYEIRCPEDYYVSLVSQKDVQKINSLWFLKCDRSESFLSECIDLNYGYGVFSKQNHELLSWVVRSEYGDPIALNTDPIYEGRGFTELMLATLFKRISDDGEDIIGFVVAENKDAERLQLKYQFQYIGQYTWIEHFGSKKQPSKL